MIPKPSGANERRLVSMSSVAVGEYLELPNGATASTISPDGSIHSVAMWYAYFDGEVYMEAKAKSQKVQNLRRDSRLTFLVHSGEAYGQFRGVMMSGTGEIIDEEHVLRRVAQNIVHRYLGIDKLQEPQIAAMTRKRVAIRLDPLSVASWDHRQLEM